MIHCFICRLYNWIRLFYIISCYLKAKFLYFAINTNVSKLYLHIRKANDLTFDCVVELLNSILKFLTLPISKIPRYNTKREHSKYDRNTGNKKHHPKFIHRFNGLRISLVSQPFTESLLCSLPVVQFHQLGVKIKKTDSWRTLSHSSRDSSLLGW